MRCGLIVTVSHDQATDEQMASTRFFLVAKITHHKIENEMHGYYILWSGRPGIMHTLCQMIEQSMQINTVHIPCKWLHYCNGQWKLHHDNTSLCVGQRVRDFLTSQGVEVIPHTPYSPDLMPCDFFCFLQVRKTTRVAILNLHRQRSAEIVFKSLAQNGFQHVFDVPITKALGKMCCHT